MRWPLCCSHLAASSERTHCPWGMGVFHDVQSCSQYRPLRFLSKHCRRQPTSLSASVMDTPSHLCCAGRDRSNRNGRKRSLRMTRMSCSKKVPSLMDTLRGTAGHMSALDIPIPCPVVNWWRNLRALRPIHTAILSHAPAAGITEHLPAHRNALRANRWRRCGHRAAPHGLLRISAGAVGATRGATHASGERRGGADASGRAPPNPPRGERRGSHDQRISTGAVVAEMMPISFLAKTHA